MGGFTIKNGFRSWGKRPVLRGRQLVQNITLLRRSDFWAADYLIWQLLATYCDDTGYVECPSDLVSDFFGGVLGVINVNDSLSVLSSVGAIERFSDGGIRLLGPDALKPDPNA